MARLERISGPRQCGEGPHWDAPTQRLLSVDIPGQDVYRWDERRCVEEKLHIDFKNDASNPHACQTSLVVPIESQPDTYAISTGRALSVLEWSGGKHTVRDFVQVDDHRPTNRFNDGKCDPQGNLWAGSMGLQTSEPGSLPPGAGALYYISPEGAATRVLDGVTCSNGLAWNSSGDRMYYIDTFSYKVDVFDCDLTGPSIGNRRTVYDVKQKGAGGFPDGMTIDTSGNIWVAMYFASMVACIDPERGQVVQQLHLPASNITSCTWGGPGHDVLYVTSALHGLEPWQLAVQPGAGCTYRVTGLGARGAPNVPWRAELAALPRA
ncbi:regucalcin-like [Pollicipes pollicipes]|uniref:regucalcin-like n=1 Tax=Pollicipes pollicipes TaxID=41117 RepID=UPI001885A1B9|nr:regucalcin-like [Pollicipes pollicipes]XP_037090304.1 regucalcin-like [Pollicipes pollicipes]XP_037090305.1 regucalcin-like [Pollicipes pollicipes]XP_037090306.1 regucalcin-like [Pollicipes pollicipes]